MINRALKLSRYLVLGSSLMSCSGASHKLPPSAQRQSQKRALKLEMMSLWVKAEYSRLMGDEIKARSIEKNLEVLESELIDLEYPVEEDVSLTSRD